MENIFQVVINPKGQFNNSKNILLLFKDSFLKIKFHQSTCIWERNMVGLKMIKKHCFLVKREYRQIRNQQ